jgi:hypothetical protein
MDLKRIMPILAIMAMMGVFLVAMQPASAASKTEIKVYAYDPVDPPGKEIGKNLTMVMGGIMDISATLHVNNGSPQWFRWVNFNVYNDHGDQIVREERNTAFGGVSRCWIDTKTWGRGKYKVCVTYLGNEDDGYPRADKEFTLTII